MKVHLVDATYELFRNFFGHPPLANPAGVEVGATHGLLGTLIRLLGREGATHVACATDHVIESFRNPLWPAYKTGEGIAARLKDQFPIAEEGMRALGLVVWPMIEFEADDALAAAAARWADAPGVEQVVICSVDKDLTQCVRGQKVVMWDRRREIVYDEPGVLAKFGVAPAQIPDYLGLVGDTADGLASVPGFGAKTAAAVLQRWGRLEEIPLDVAAWKGVKVRGAERLVEALREHRERALLMKQLATLRLDVPLAETLEQLEWKGAPKEAFQAFCLEHGFKRLAERPGRWATPAGPDQGAGR